MGSSPITCSSVTHWASMPRGMQFPQAKKMAGTVRPLERGVLLLGHADPGPRGRAGGHQRGLPGQIEELNRDICLKRCAISTHNTLRPSPRGPEGGEAVGLVDDLAIQVRKLPALGCRLPRPMPIAKNDGHEF